MSQSDLQRLLYWQNLCDMRLPPFHTPSPGEKQERAKQVAARQRTHKEQQAAAKRSPLTAIEAGDVVGSRARYALGLAWQRFKAGKLP